MKQLDNRKIFKPLAEEYGIIAILLFGSMAKGTSHQLSDIDIGIVFNRFPPKVYDIGIIYADFGLAVKKIYGNHKIDIVFLQETSISMQYRAVSEGELIFALNSDAYADYVEYVLKYYFDFLPVEQEFHRALLT